MAAELKKLAQEFIDRGYLEFGRVLEAQVPVARKLGVPESFPSVEVEGPETKSSALKRSTEEYRNNPTLESLRHFFQAFWTEKGTLVGKKITVPEFSATPKEFKQMIENDISPVFFPREVDLTDLEKIFPGVVPSWVIEKREYISNINGDPGWLLFDSSIKTPNRSETDVDLKRIIKERGKRLATLKQYIIGSQIIKWLTGECIDESPKASILDSEYNDKNLSAGFGPNGTLVVQPYFAYGSCYGSVNGRGVARWLVNSKLDPGMKISTT